MYPRFALAALILGGCAAPLPAPRAAAPAAVAGAQNAAPEGRRSFLYANGVYLSKYALGSSVPLVSIGNPSYGNGFPAFTVNDKGYLFAETGNVSNGFITVYNARTLVSVQEIPQIYSTFFATDSNGYVYGANCGLAILVFAPDGSGVVNVLRRRMRSEACTLAFDRANNLYVPQADGINVFVPSKAPGHFDFSHRLTTDIRGPGALALSASGKLFVANWPGRNHRGRGNYVSVYAPNGGRQLRTITDGVGAPITLIVDSKGRLYVANGSSDRRLRPGWISVYAPGGGKPIRKITAGIEQPVALAVDASDNLYVADQSANAVLVYASGGTKLIRTITEGVAGTNTLVIAAP